ncbi:MAG TPA: mevalonate kinase [Anaerolineales bacterium]|nr:mevalonate kinase [Anaerolineales bacterium]
MPVTASAPGKLMLFGEHAVVYRYPCIVTAVDLRYSVTVEQVADPIITIDTPVMRKYDQSFSAPIETILRQTNYPKAAAFVLAAVKQFHNRNPFDGGLSIRTDGPEVSYGLGSSSAVTVASIAALAEQFKVTAPLGEIYTMAVEAVLEVQGKGSGFDVASAVYGGTLYFAKGGREIEPLEVPDLPIVIGFSGDKVSTTNLIDQVSGLMARNPETVEGIFKVMNEIVWQAQRFLDLQDWAGLGDLMNINQGLLDALGVSTSQLAKQVFAARKAGAFGAKLSGAGGGDCMFALVDPGKKQAVCEAIEESGGILVSLDTGVNGVRIEPIQ